jgi:hypothetical protein
MAAFDAVYIPALSLTSSASTDASVGARALAATQALDRRWPAMRPRLAQVWGTPAWSGALDAVHRQIAAAVQAAGLADWHAAHEALEEVRIVLMKARQAHGMDYFVDRLTAYHEPMEVLALAGKGDPARLTREQRAGLERAYGEALRLWEAVERHPVDPQAYGLTPARQSQMARGLAEERAALDALGRALQGQDPAALLEAAGAVKPPFARLFTSFGDPAARPAQAQGAAPAGSSRSGRMD